MKLLADFVADMAVVWMKLFQLTSESVNIFVGEFGLTELSYDVQHVQRPAALRGFDFADGFEPGVTGADLGGVSWQTGGNDGDASFGRDAV